MKDRKWNLLLMMVTVPLAGEFKFYPFEDTFRVSLGTPVFFLFLLWGRVHPIIAGVLTGLSVFVFRFLLAVGIQNISVEEAMYLHFPAFCYYVVYAFLFYLAKMNERHDQPFIIGFFGVGLEIFASLSEMVFRSFLAYNQGISLLAIEQLVMIAFIRSFFVLGFFNIFKLREAKLAEEEQRKQKEKMLLFIANLFEESVQLKKTMQHSEEITRMCYDFYRRLKSGENRGSDAQTALQIAGLVHEIKKDNQRIYAGLSELMSSENIEDYMMIEQLGNIMIVSNRRYAESLCKTIYFTLYVEGDHPPYHVYMVLSFINNLLANAVEAIQDEGEVSLHVKRKDQIVEFHVSDNGPGIAPKLKEVIFTEGFTTKFDTTGNPSTGIGLSYVKQTVEKLGGEITLMNTHKVTTFIVKLPVVALIEKGLAR